MSFYFLILVFGISVSKYILLQTFWRKLCVNKKLISLGLCKVNHMEVVPESPAYHALLLQLVKLESIANRKGIGLWAETKPEKYKLWKWLKVKLTKLFRRNKS